MPICRQNPEMQPRMNTQEDIDWTEAVQSYPNIDEAQSFIAQQRQAAGQHVFTTTANLQGKQLQVYTINRPAPPLIHQCPASADGSIWHSWHREVLPNPLSPTSPAASGHGCSSNWCGCLQH